MDPTEIAVVGGGVIGLALAERLAADGREVTIVDESPGAGATAVAAGMLAPVTEVHFGEEELLRLNLASSEMYGGWVAGLEDATGLATGYRSSGTLMVARDLDDNSALEDLFRFQLGLGLAVERLKGRDCREIEPALAPSVRGGILVAGDHQIDPQALATALLAACHSRGVRMEMARARSIVVEADALRGVMLSNGEMLETSTVIVAAGAWSGSIGGVRRLPVRPVKGQLLRFSARGAPLPLVHNIRGLDAYLVPRADGRMVVGATVEELGFDDAVTAGAVRDLMQAAYELVPGITELRFDAALAGFRPGTPDNAPFIGPTEVEGLVAATGHYRNGILLAPVTAEAIAALFSTGRVTEVARPFSPLRVKTEPKVDA